MYYIKIFDKNTPRECIAYYKDKELRVTHREDGPAVEYINGDKEWWVNGKFHREDGPAVEWKDGYKQWFINGKLHREDGPAIEESNGKKFYYLNDIEYEEKEYWAKVKLGAFV